jgi:hypothetical protein
MERGAKTLILGIALGAAAVTLAYRMRQLLEERDPDTLMTRLQEEMDDLERRLHLPKKA